MISVDRGYIRFRFKINMHIDNLEALNTIKSILQIGSVTVDKDKNYCSFVVQDFSHIRDIVLILGKVLAKISKVVVLWSSDHDSHKYSFFN